LKTLRKRAYINTPQQRGVNYINNTKGERSLVISKNNERLTIIISKSLKEEIRKLAEKENRSMGNYIVNILQNHVEQTKYSNR
jgi:hypothetical protein